MRASAVGEQVMIRRATPSDLIEMAKISDQYRNLLRSFSPVFWQKASNAIGIHKEYLATLLEKRNLFAFVYDEAIEAIEAIL